MASFQAVLAEAGLNDDATMSALAMLQCSTMEQVLNYSEEELLRAGMKPFKARKLISLAKGGATRTSQPGSSFDHRPPGPPPGPPPLANPGGFPVPQDGGIYDARGDRMSTESGFSVSASNKLVSDADTLLETALELLRRKEVERAVVFAEQSVAIYKAAWKQQNPQEPPPERASAAFSLAAELFMRLNRPQDAEKYCKSLLRLQRRSLGDGHAATGESLFMLGRIQRKMGKLESAGRAFGDSLRVRLHALGQEDSRTGSSFYYLGVVFEEQGRLDEALHNFVEALKIFRQTVGPEHRDTAEALNNIASVLYRQGNLEKAKSAYERALDLKLAVYGEEHGSTADTLYNLSMLLRDMGQLNDAAGYAQRTYDISFRNHGVDHPRTADAKEHLDALQAQVKTGGKGGAAADPKPKSPKRGSSFSRKKA